MLKPIAENVWSHERDIAMPAGMRMPCRATILRLPDGGLLLHSPLKIDDATAAEIDALGDVRVIVAPNCMHWLFLEKAARRYPNARVLGAAKLASKLGDFPFERLPEGGALPGVDGIRVLRIEGAPMLDEHVFFHEASRSLVVTDLLFNVHACESFGMRLSFRLFGTWRKTSQSRVWRFLVKDRVAAARSASRLLEWPFERVIVAHGDVVETEARERVRGALRWMIGPKTEDATATA